MPIATVILPKGNRDATDVAGFAAAIAAGAGARVAGIVAIAREERSRGEVRAGATAGAIVTAIENVVRDVRLPSGGVAWLPMFLTRVERLIRTAAPDAAVSTIIAYVEPPNAHHRAAVRIAATGSVAAILIHASAQRPVAVDLVTAAPPAPAVAFAHTVDGEIGSRDAILLATENIPRSIPRAMLVHALAASDRTSGMSYLDHAIHTVATPAVAVVVSADDGQSSPRTQGSMAAFLATTATTERYLTPSLRPAVAAYWTDVRSALARVRVARAHRGQPPRALTAATDGIRIVFRTLALATRTIAALILDAIAWVIRRAFARRPPRMTKPARASSPRAHAAPARTHTPRDLRARLHAAIAAARVYPQRVRAWVRALPPMSRTLFLLAIASGVLFLGSTALLAFRRTREVDVAAYNVTVNRIADLQASAEAKLLFGDTTAARGNLLEARDLLATLPRTSRPRRERADAIAHELDATLDRARLLTRIAEPLRVARAGDTIAIASIADIALAGRTIVAVPPEGTPLALVNARDGTAATRAVTPTPPAPIRRAVALDDRLVLLLDTRGGLALVDITNGARTELDAPFPPGTAVDIDTTRGHITVLHRDGSVTRHERTTTGLDAGTLIVAKSAATAHAQSLLVTGSVSIAAGSTVTTFTGGRRASAHLTDAIDPPITSTAILAAAAGGDPIYVADPAIGRIAAVTRAGKLVGQVQSDALRGLTRVIADPLNPILFVLHGGDVSVVVPPKLRT